MMLNLENLLIIFFTTSSLLTPPATAHRHDRHLHRRQAAASSPTHLPVIGPGTTSKSHQQCNKREITLATSSETSTTATAKGGPTGVPHLITASILCK